MTNSRVVRKALVLVGGVVLLVIGIAGIVLPVLPGFVFIAAGLVLMAREFVWADRILGSVRSRLEARGLLSPSDDDSESTTVTDPATH